MSVVQQVFDITEQLNKLFDQPTEKANREHVIQTITNLLDQREPLLVNVKPPYTELEKKQAEQIVTWNERITSAFIDLKNEVQRDLTQLKKTKSSAVKYVNPYQNVRADGMFYDKRK